MKSLSFILFATCIAVISFGQVTKKNVSQIKQTTSASIMSIDGAWQLVWAKYNDTLADMSNHFLVKTFNNGTFTLIAHDSSGKIKFTGYGKYVFEGDAYHETFIYHNYTKYKGGEDWQDLQLKGDTLYLNAMTKVIVGGKDVTVGWTRINEKLVRVKW